MKLVEVQRTYKLAQGQQITIAHEVGEDGSIIAREVGIVANGNVIASFTLTNRLEYMAFIAALDAVDKGV